MFHTEARELGRHVFHLQVDDKVLLHAPSDALFLLGVFHVEGDPDTVLAGSFFHSIFLGFLFFMHLSLNSNLLLSHYLSFCEVFAEFRFVRVVEISQLRSSFRLVPNL